MQILLFARRMYQKARESGTGWSYWPQPKAPAIHEIG
jgi:hypothetical protein